MRSTPNLHVGDGLRYRWPRRSADQLHTGGGTWQDFSYSWLSALFLHTGLAVNPEIVNLHVSLRGLDRCETKLCVKAVGIASKQVPAPQPLQPGVCHDALHHPLAQAMTTVRFQYKHITEISISRIIGNHTSKTRLFFCMVHAEAQRVLNGRSDDLLWNPFCPVALSQKSMDYVQIQARTIGADEEISSSIL